jgi:hypothetical protein
MKSSMLAGLLASFMCASWAGLGGSPANLGPHVMASQSKPGASAVYTEVQKDLDSGTTVHEYLDANGVVFAVSWSGPVLPDLKEILGPHFAAMAAQGARQGPGQRSHLSVRRPEVVIASEGHMGAFQGRAWLPARLPAGFDPHNIE